MKLWKEYQRFEACLKFYIQHGIMSGYFGWTNRINITMTSHERHVVSNHQSFDCFFNSLCGLTSKKHQIPHYWPFVRGIHGWLVNSLHKGPATQKKLPFDGVIMNTTWVSGITVAVILFSFKFSLGFVYISITDERKHTKKLGMWNT